MSELSNLRKGPGLTEAKLISSRSDLLNLTAVEQMVGDSDTPSTRARAAIALIHHVLHGWQTERSARALAWAFNLDVAAPWNGQQITLSDELLMVRRRQLAELEMVAEDNGKPMSDWEAEAFDLLVHELGAMSRPPIDLAGSAWSDDESIATDPQVDSGQHDTAEPVALATEEVALDGAVPPSLPTSIPPIESHDSHGLSRVQKGALATASAILLVLLGAALARSLGSSTDADSQTVAAAEEEPDAQPTSTVATPAAPTATNEPASAEPAAAPTPTAPSPTAPPTPTPEPTATSTPVPPTPTTAPTPVPQPSPAVLLASIEPVSGNWYGGQELRSLGFSSVGRDGFGTVVDERGSPMVVAFNSHCDLTDVFEVQYDLDQQYSRLSGALAAHSGSDSTGAYSLSFFADAEPVPAWYGVVSLFSDPLAIDLDVSGVRRLQLVYRPTECGDEVFRVDLREAELQP